MPNKNHIAISNTPHNIIRETAEGNWFDFQETPKMSTYLLAIIIGKFDYSEVISKGVNGDISVRGYTP